MPITIESLRKGDASKYETKYRANTSLINSARHARPLSSVFFFLSFFFFTYILEHTCISRQADIECIDDWFSCRSEVKGREEARKKKREIKKGGY